MAQLTKAWENGGNLSATYEGSGDGEAVFSSDTNEGIDREMSVTFEGGGISVERQVTQEGLRQRFITADGKVFCISGGGRFAVLKEGGIEPPTPEEPTIETYTRLAYIESTGEQYIPIDYTLKATDAIEVLYQRGERMSADQFLFGASNAWISTYNLTSYARFGASSSTSISNGYYRSKVRLSQGKAVWDGGQTTSSLTYTELSESTINLFAGRSSTGSAYNRGAFAMFYFRVYDGDNIVVDLTPAKRDSDGKIGMLDLVSGKFYSNADNGTELIAGAEMRMDWEEYERIDRVTFNNDKGYDTGVYGNEKTYIDVMFQRTDTSGADYLFGCSSGSRITGYLTSSGYWRYGSAAPQFNCNNKDILIANVTPTRTDINTLYRTFSTSAFTTSRTIPVGGHKASTSADTITKTYQGYIYYFRIKHGSNVVADLYPCKRKSDGVEGFWDCVSQTFIEPV